MFKLDLSFACDDRELERRALAFVLRPHKVGHGDSEVADDLGADTQTTVVRWGESVRCVSPHQDELFGTLPCLLLDTAAGIIEQLINCDFAVTVKISRTFKTFEEVVGKDGGFVAMDFPGDTETGGDDPYASLIAFLGELEIAQIKRSARTYSFELTVLKEFSVALKATKLSDDLSTVTGVKDRDPPPALYFLEVLQKLLVLQRAFFALAEVEREPACMP